jgi:hypothetical protein
MDRVEAIRGRLGTFQIRAGKRELSNRASLAIGGGVAAALIVALLGTSLMLAVGGGHTPPATPAPTSAPLAAASASATPPAPTSSYAVWTPDPNHTWHPDPISAETTNPDPTPTSSGGGYTISDNVSVKLRFECDQDFGGSNRPVFSGRLVYIDCATKTSSVVTFAFDGSTGAIKHRYETGVRGQLYVDKGLWYSPASGGVVYRLDPNSGQATFSLDDATLIAGQPGSVWARLSDGTAVRIDTTTLAVTPVTSTLNEWGQLCGRLWGTNEAYEITSTDPATGKLLATYKLADGHIELPVYATPQGCWAVAWHQSGMTEEAWFVKLGDSGIQAQSPRTAAWYPIILGDCAWMPVSPSFTNHSSATIPPVVATAQQP